jgi:uncharacterized membrane protein YidH (DUF202 family)
MLVLVGIGALVAGIVKHGHEPTTEEKTGYLVQHFGANGVSVGMIVMGVAFAVVGILVTALKIRARRLSA